MTEPPGSQGAHAWLPALPGGARSSLAQGLPLLPTSSPAEMILAWDSARTAPRHRPPPGAHALSWHQQHRESTSLGRGGQQVLLAAGQVSTGQHLPWGCGGADGRMQGPHGHQPQTRELPHSLGREGLPWRNVTSANLACASKCPCHIREDPRAAGERSVPGARGAEGV